MISKLEIDIIRRLQEGLPLVSRPFGVMAYEIGITEAELIKRIADLKNKGLLKRFGAVVRHQKLGFAGNALVVWKTNEARLKEIGMVFAGFPQISHCYQRETVPEWPYNLYTMVHGRTEADCLAIVRQLVELSGIADYQVLFSRMEFKKESMRYFSEHESVR